MLFSDNRFVDSELSSRLQRSHWFPMWNACIFSICMYFYISLGLCQAIPFFIIFMAKLGSWNELPFIQQANKTHATHLPLPVPTCFVSSHISYFPICSVSIDIASCLKYKSNPKNIVFELVRNTKQHLNLWPLGPSGTWINYITNFGQFFTLNPLTITVPHPMMKLTQPLIEGETTLKNSVQLRWITPNYIGLPWITTV